MQKQSLQESGTLKYFNHESTKPTNTRKTESGKVYSLQKRALVNVFRSSVTVSKSINLILNNIYNPTKSQILVTN